MEGGEPTIVEGGEPTVGGSSKGILVGGSSKGILNQKMAPWGLFPFWPHSPQRPSINFETE